MVKRYKTPYSKFAGSIPDLQYKPNTYCKYNISSYILRRSKTSGDGVQRGRSAGVRACAGPLPRAAHFAPPSDPPLALRHDTGHEFEVSNFAVNSILFKLMNRIET